ncbi:class I SAM-dependent methyltransferase [Roseimicrobium sp. ORNL1]|uniref:class I SAM-dependent methyltransferase n=1 Tax=Roseimicrobium sp. ORNL1 TaxID=2711231 RepID=UPI0013E1D7E8|nr:class I SAM-dependent methyltransferase [Roseimicrobium sp. ORNL1]QIF03259.1 class I SAM-dependent methyltransferase [Roseimicrobium sp. ORNL1]
MIGNQNIGKFYNWTRWLYPLVEPFLGRTRKRLLAAVNEQSPGKVLEIGVGRGSHLGGYRASHVTGVDVSSGMVQMASQQARSVGSDMEMRVMDGEALEFGDATFDRVVMAYVLSVTAHPERMLAEAWRVLRPGGFAYIVNHETSAFPHGLVSRVRQWLRLRSKFRLSDIPGWPFASVVRRESLLPGGWFTLVVLQK